MSFLNVFPIKYITSSKMNVQKLVANGFVFDMVKVPSVKTLMCNM